MSKSELWIWADGAARGNPGPAAIGIVVKDASGNELVAQGHVIGRSSNNVAEYSAVLCGLIEALALGARRVTLSTDSELVTKQLKGEYKVRDGTLQVFHTLVCEAASKLDEFCVTHIMRSLNKRADTLANEALDKLSDR